MKIEWTKILSGVIAAAPGLPDDGDAAAAIAIGAVSGVESVRKPSKSKVAEIQKVLAKIADTPLGRKLAVEWTVEGLERLDRGAFKKVLATARFIAGILADYGTIDTGNALLNWIIETALQALREPAA